MCQGEVMRGIAAASHAVGVGEQTLRLYERRGLLSPARTSGGTRRYCDADLHRIRRIRQLVDDGINLAGILRVLELEATIAILHAERASAV